MNLYNGYEKVSNEGTIANSWDQISDLRLLNLMPWHHNLH